MQVRIESTICQWNNETADVIVRFIRSSFARLLPTGRKNMLTLAKTRRELEQALDFSPFKELYKKHLQWGWGGHHLWVKQVCPYNGSVAENRLLIVEF